MSVKNPSIAQGCNFHFETCLHSFPSISKTVVDVKTEEIEHVNNTHANNWVARSQKKYETMAHFI